MLSKTAFAVLLGLLVGASAPAQVLPPEKGNKSDEILAKIARLDVLNFLLPVDLKKDQYKKLLPIIEKIRETTRKIQEAEAEELKKLEIEVDKALKDALDRKMIPTAELRNKIGAKLRGFGLNRQIRGDLNVDTIYTELDKMLAVGQRKVMANSLDPKDYDPAAKPEEMKEADKIRLFIREILLNPSAYDVMVKLSL